MQTNIFSHWMLIWEDKRCGECQYTETTAFWSDSCCPGYKMATLTCNTAQPINSVTEIYYELASQLAVVWWRCLRRLLIEMWMVWIRSGIKAKQNLMHFLCPNLPSLHLAEFTTKQCIFPLSIPLMDQTVNRLLEPTIKTLPHTRTRNIRFL